MAPPAPQTDGARDGGIVLTRVETDFLKLLGECVLGNRSYGDGELVSLAKSLGFRSRREVEFVGESFREGGDPSLEFTPREVGMYLRRRHISRLLDWGFREGLCSGYRVDDLELQSWLCGLIRDEGREFRERKWAADLLVSLRSQDIRRATQSSGGAGARVQIVIGNPYGGSESVTVRGVCSVPSDEDPERDN